MGSLSKLIPLVRAVSSSRPVFEHLSSTSRFNYKTFSSSSSFKSGQDRQGSNKETMKDWSIITKGLIVLSGGISLLTMAKNFMAQKDNSFEVKLAPSFPFLHCRLPLWRIEVDKVEHADKATMSPGKLGAWKFRYQHLAVALGLEIEQSDTNESILQKVSSWSRNEWSLKVAALFGSDDYGERKVHHVLLTNAQRIKRDIEAQQTKLQVSPDSANWIWMSEPVVIITLIWDDVRRTYRSYTYEGYVLMDILFSKQTGDFVRPVSIKFISEKPYPSIIEGYNPTCKAVIVNNFDEDMMVFQQKSRFL